MKQICHGAVAALLALAVAVPAAAQAPAVPAPDAPAPAQPAPSGQSIGQQIAALHWVAGPGTMQVGDNARFNIPSGGEMLAPPDSVKYLKLNGNPTSADDNADYILQPIDPSANWFALLFYVDSGHIADDQKIDANQLLDQVKRGTEADNAERQKEGLPTLTLKGWAQQPSYDTATHRLQWAFDFTNPDGSEVVNLDTRILSRTGNLKVILVDDPRTLNADMPAFNGALDGFAFNAGQRYADYLQGDKLATYGIAGLIAGGAAAAAVKTGLLGTILAALAASGKAIAAAAVAAVALLRKQVGRLFGKKG